MPIKKPWTWKNIGAGYFEVHLSSWKHFTDFIYDVMQDYDTYVWRGHRCDDWKLEPTLDRLIRDAEKPSAKEYDFQTKHLDNFKYAARGRRGANPPELDDENGWWAIGQHHGLATPLLDWTTSPYVAAFFAFIDIGENQTSNRAIYALHRPTVDTRSISLAHEENKLRIKRRSEIDKGDMQVGLLRRYDLDREIKPEVQFIRPLSDENQRLVNQGGLFTRAPLGMPLEDWIQKHHEEEDKAYMLIKITVPDKDRKSCLRNLNRMNINHLSLFPDMFGASRFCNLFSEIENY